MPRSFRHLDALIADRVGLDFPDRQRTRILDIGAGAGKYRDLLWDYPNVDAVEAHAPYVERYQLRERYREVMVCDIMERYAAARPYFMMYDLFVLGDVLEHLSVEDAQTLLSWTVHEAILVAVPFNYEQDAVDGVEWEVHKQPDLTHEIFMERYPGFDCLARDEQYGVYVRDPLGRWTLDEVPEKPHVMISVPTSDWRHHLHLTVGLWETQQLHLKNGLAPLTLMFQNGARIDTSRNKVLANFLRLREDAPDPPTHLLFIDSDQGFSSDLVGRLLDHHAQMVGAPIRKKTQQLAWTISGLPDNNGETTWNGRLMEVGGCGTGALMMTRSAAERIARSCETITDDVGPHPLAFQNTDLGEDLEFCRKWRGLGGRVWADPSIEICHIGVAEFTGKMIDHLELSSRFEPQLATKEDEAA